MKHSKYLLIYLILLLSISTFAQTEREKGVEFYKKADYNSAVTFLNNALKTNKSDAESWNLMGMAYLNLKKYKESKKSFENAIKYDPANAKYLVNLTYVNILNNKFSDAKKAVEKAILIDGKSPDAYYFRGTINLQQNNFEKAISDAEMSINLSPKSTAAYILKSDSNLYLFGIQLSKNQKPGDNLNLLEKSVQSLEECLKICSQPSDLPTVQFRLEDSKAFLNYFNRKKDAVIGQVTEITNDPTVTPLKILSKPKALYTDDARQGNVQGTVSLVVLFSANGKTKSILVMKQLSGGLTKNAIKAAQNIEFTPEMKDGKPVSIVKQIDYTFTLY